jgi:hypothetical protein
LILKIILRDGVETQELVPSDEVADINSLVDLYSQQIFEERRETNG